jgi:ribonuclease HI
MICISWNCRGLGNQGTVQELAKLVRIKDPSVLFLSETWMDEDRLEGLRCRFNFSNKFVVKRINKGGGLVLFWKYDLNLSICSYSLNHIDSLIDSNTDQPWRLTCFYGAPETHLRDQSWNLLRNLHGQFSLPWCCVGDFNEIVRSSEKCGRRDQSERQMQRFRAVIDDCGFLDLGFRGFPFTWCNNRRGTATTWLRLDRFMATNDWILRFSSAVVDHLESTTSDHKPICLSTQPVRMTRPRKKLFRFEDMWRSDPSCEPTITKAWVTKTRGSPMVQATGKIQNCGAALTGWSRKQFGHITKLLREKTEQLRRAEMDSIHGCGHDTVISIRKEVSDLLLKEERMWKQRSRESWLKEGDHNTKFFHNRASHRKRRNTISALRMANGEVVTDENLIGAQFIEYYQALFTAQPLEDTEVVLDSIQPCVTQEMNQSLTCPFTEEEVLIAMKQMGPLKAPGPDGMPPIFYQSYWHVVGKDITAAVLYCLQSGTLLPALNHTFVTLIPKTKSPETVTEYRPISLCNVLYKLISKVLANRLKKILPHIISETQSAFVPGRLITDNILIAFETLHHMHNKRTGKVGSMALKLDMSKAYDRVEWGFVKQVMVRMGFHEKWISLILECISSVSYSLLINGTPTGHIIPTRGLRQGDPISPYLFLLCAEGLNGLIKKASTQGEIHGVSLCPRGPQITNLFFADDSLLFCRASLRECHKIQEILAIYEKASGQQLNRAKTNLFFSRNTTQATQEDIKEILGVPSIQQYEKYLGLPSLVGKEKITCFSQIKERVWSKVKGWKEKLLSQAGQEILIKAVVQAIPTYTMNCFKLPVTLCKEIEGIIRRFWWGQTSDRRKIHWIRWEKLCNSKGEGGLGFRDLQKFNLALLAKQFWRFMHNQNSLIYKVFSAKFFPHGNILEASEKTRGSFAWRSILKAKGLILSGLSWRVGDGAQIPIKGSNWLLEEGHRRILSPLTNLPVDAKVEELIHGSPPTWNTHKIHSLFLPYDVEAILKIPLSGRQQEDRLYWFETQNGKYSVRSGYKLLCKDDRANIPESSRQWDPDPLWKRIWRARVPAKIRTFLWRACHDSLPTKLGLFKRQVTPNPLCETCRAQSEDSLHALWKCPAVSRVWSLDPDFSDLQNLAPMSLSALMRQIIQSNSDHLFEKFAITSWLLWHKRNQDRLRLPSDPHSQILPRAHALLSEYLAVTTENKPQKPLPPQVRWKPPSSNLFKVNFDGAIFRESNTGGLGVVIRDKTGMVIATLSQKVTGNHTAEMIEALAARRAIRFAMEVGVTNAEFEGDAETVIRDLYRTAPIYTPYGLVIEDAKVLLAEIQNFSLSHTRRSGNSVAHALARRASKCHSYLVWMEEVPPDINHVLLNDLSALAVE